MVEDEPRPGKLWLTPRVGIGLAVLGVIATAAMIALGFGETKAGAGTEAPPEIATSVPPMEVAEPHEADRPSANDLEPPVDETVGTPITEPAIEAPPRDQRTRPRQRAKPQTGTINLVTRGGWAEIYKGKKSLGSTPRRLTLPSGRHKLVLKPFGDGKPKVVYVAVEAHKLKKVWVSLD